MEDLSTGVEELGIGSDSIGRDGGVSDAIVQALEAGNPEGIEGSEDLFQDIDDINLYLETGKSTKKYPSQEILNHISIESITLIHERVIIKCISGNRDTIEDIIDCITPENISDISWRIIDVMMTHLKDDEIRLRKIKQNLRKKITKENEGKIDRFILDACDYGGERGKFIRTFSPESQKWWIKRFNFYDRVKKSIGLTGPFV